MVSRGSVDPDDLLGEVWLQVARNISSFNGDETGFRSWVFMIAHHRIVDERRRHGRQPAMTAPEEMRDDWAGVAESAEEEALIEVETRELLSMLALLTDEQRDVLALRVIGDLTVEQVAEILGKRPGAVKGLQRRGLRALSRKVEKGVPL